MNESATNPAEVDAANADAVQEQTEADDGEGVLVTTVDAESGDAAVDIGVSDEAVAEESADVGNEDGDLPVDSGSETVAEEQAPSSYDDFKSDAERTLVSGHDLRNQITTLNEQRQNLLGRDSLDDEQQQVLDDVNVQYLELSEQVAQQLESIDDLLNTGFYAEDAEELLYPSLTKLKGDLIRTIDEEAKIELSLDDVVQAQQFLIEKKDELSSLVGNLDELFRDQPQVGDLTPEFVMASVASGIFDEFDEKYSQVLEKINEVNPGSIDLSENPDMDQSFNVILETKQLIEGLRVKKDAAVIMISEFSGTLTAESQDELNQNIDDLVTGGSLTPEEAKNLKTRFEQVQEYANMGIDGFIELNKGSSLDTFLAFLIDPVTTSGREGLTFGKTNVEQLGEVEVIPIHLFRALFTDSKKVGSVLKNVMESVDPSWRSENGEMIDDLKDGDDPEQTKKVLMKVFKELLTNNAKQDEYRKRFRAFFATGLMGKDKDNLQYMDDNSFLFLVDNLKDGGTKLDSLWKINK